MISYLSASYACHSGIKDGANLALSDFSKVTSFMSESTQTQMISDSDIFVCVCPTQDFTKTSLPNFSSLHLLKDCGHDFILGKGIHTEINKFKTSFASKRDMLKGNLDAQKHLPIGLLIVPIVQKSERGTQLTFFVLDVTNMPRPDLIDCMGSGNFVKFSKLCFYKLNPEDSTVLSVKSREIIKGGLSAEELYSLMLDTTVTLVQSSLTIVRERRKLTVDYNKLVEKPPKISKGKESVETIAINKDGECVSGLHIGTTRYIPTPIGAETNVSPSPILIEVEEDKVVKDTNILRSSINNRHKNLLTKYKK